MTAMTLAQEARCDPTLALVLRYTREGWPTEVPKHMEPYFFHRQELSVEQDCVMWGVRVLVPGSLQSSMLQELHAGHLGIVKMKSLARSYIWWPGIDQEIEATTKSCDGCQRMKVNQQLVPVHPWEYPEGPWRRIHVDYAGPFESHMFLVVVDAFSKWPEVVVMKDSDALHTIEALREMFSRWGISRQLVTDNGPQFVSNMFQRFMKSNGIKHVLSAHTIRPQMAWLSVSCRQ